MTIIKPKNGPFKAGQLIRMRTDCQFAKNVKIIDDAYLVLAVMPGLMPQLREYIILCPDGRVHKSQWNQFDELRYEVVSVKA